MTTGRRIVWTRLSQSDQLTHSELVRWALDYFNRQPMAYAFPTHGDRNLPEEPGITDIILCQAGRTVFYEVKVGKDSVRPSQHEFHRRMHAAGMTVRILNTTGDVITGGKEWPTDSLKKAKPTRRSTGNGKRQPKQAGMRRRYPGK